MPFRKREGVKLDTLVFIGKQLKTNMEGKNRTRDLPIYLPPSLKMWGYTPRSGKSGTALLNICHICGKAAMLKQSNIKGQPAWVEPIHLSTI